MKQNQYLGNKTGWWYGPLWGSRKVTWIIMDFTSHLWLCDCFYLVLCTKCDTLSITNDFVVVFLMNFVQSVILYVSLMTFWLFFFSIYVQSVIFYLSLMTLWFVFLRYDVQSVIFYPALMTLWFVFLRYDVQSVIFYPSLMTFWFVFLRYDVQSVIFNVQNWYFPHSTQ